MTDEGKLPRLRLVDDVAIVLERERENERKKGRKKELQKESRTKEIKR